jgi:hypothetical protein
MANNPTTQDHNATTGEIVIREMTDAEFAQYKKDMELGAERLQARQAAEAAKEAAEAKLAALGLTTDDLRALGL